MLATILARTRSNPPDPYLIGGIVLVVIAGIVLAWWWDRSRRKGIMALLRAMGFQVQETQSKLDPTEHAQILGNPLLLYARNTVSWSAIGEHNGKVVRLVEYKYVTGAGKSQQTHYHFIASTDLPIELPEFVIERKRWFTGHRPLFKGMPLPVADPAISDAFTCYAAHPAGATTLITPPVCALISKWDKSKWLRFSSGTLSIALRKRASIKNIRPLLEELDLTLSAFLEGAGVS